MSAPMHTLCNQIIDLLCSIESKKVLGILVEDEEWYPDRLSNPCLLLCILHKKAKMPLPPLAAHRERSVRRGTLSAVIKANIVVVRVV